MLRKFKLATFIAVALSACGTMGSAHAGGHGSSHGGGSGRSHSSGGFSGGSFKMGGNSGGSTPRIYQSNGSNGSNVLRSNGIKLGSSGSPGNTGIAGGIKTLPKNTGIVPPVVRIGGTSNGTGIKLPGSNSNGNSNKPNIGNVLSGNVLKNTNVGNQVLQNIGGSSQNNKLKGLGGLGIAIGEPNPSKPGNKPGNGNGIGSGNGNGNGHHHHHNHCWPSLVFTLPVCQPNYCPPPCPPIYYPQPYPVAVPVPVPVDANGNPIDPNAVPAGPAGPAPAAPPMGLPTETKQALEDTVATEAPAADAEVKPASATTEVVSKEVPLPQIPVGATLTLNGKDLTEKEGQVVLQLGDIALPATIKEWKNDSVTCTLPVLGLTKPSKAILHVLKADGKTANTMNCELVTTLPTSVEARPTTTDIEAAKYEQ